MYNKCCIPNCESLRQDVKLHRLPKFGTILQKWLQCIPGASSLNLRCRKKLFVCHKHFEKRFTTEKSRIRLGTCPTLFTVEEIRSGIPVDHSQNQEHFDSQADHKYARQMHIDHTYHKCKDMTGLSDDIDDMYAENTQMDENPAVSWDPIDENHKGVGLPQVFSWEQQEVEEICQNDYDGDLHMDKDTALIERNSGKNDREVPSIKGFVCNNCNIVIERFVYKCVQCFDFDLCGDCERAGEHCTHFLLRVPEDKHRDEVQAVLSRLRLELFTDGHSEIKTEIKEEPTGPLDPIDSSDFKLPLETNMSGTPFFDGNMKYRLIEDAHGNLVDEDTNIVQDIDMLLDEEDSNTEDESTEDDSGSTSRSSKRLCDDSDDFQSESSEESDSAESSGDPLEIGKQPAKRPRMLLKGPRGSTTPASDCDTSLVRKEVHVALKPISIEELAKYRINR